MNDNTEIAEGTAPVSGEIPEPVTVSDAPEHLTVPDAPEHLTVPDAPEHLTVPDDPAMPEEPIDTPEPAKPKSKKGIIIAIAAIAVVVIIILAYVLTSGHEFEGKWVAERTEILNPDGSVNTTYIAQGGEWLDIRPDGSIIYGNESGVHDLSEFGLTITWEYLTDQQIKFTNYYEPPLVIPNRIVDPDSGRVYWTNTTLSQESQVYVYEVDGDNLSLGYLTPNSGVTLRTYYVRV